MAIIALFPPKYSLFIGLRVLSPISEKALVLFLTLKSQKVIQFWSAL